MGASRWDYWVPHDPDVQVALQTLRDDVFRRGAFYRFDAVPVATIDELLDHNAEAGTHSVLDVSLVTDGYDDGAVWPLTTEEHEALFGTARPTHAQIEAAKDRWDHVLARWTARYVVAYRDEKPDELYFFGVSGD